MVSVFNLFLVFTLIKLILLKILSQSALECGRLRTPRAKFYIFRKGTSSFVCFKHESLYQKISGLSN